MILTAIAVFSNNYLLPESNIFLAASASFHVIEKPSIPLNLIGKQICELRKRKGWTQEDLAAKLQVFGWDVSRESLAKLETQNRRVPDGELFILAKILGTSTDKLFPANVNIRKLGPDFRMRLSRNRVKNK